MSLYLTAQDLMLPDCIAPHASSVLDGTGQRVGLFQACTGPHAALIPNYTGPILSVCQA